MIGEDANAVAAKKFLSPPRPCRSFETLSPANARTSTSRIPAGIPVAVPVPATSTMLRYAVPDWRAHITRNATDTPSSAASA